MVVYNNILAGAAGSGGDAGYKIERSLRFNPGDSSHLTKSFSSTGNRRTFTLSYWIKECGKGTSPSNNPHILWSGADVNTRGGIVHRGTGTDANKLYLFDQVNATTYCSVWSNSLHRDFSAWKHIVWAVDTTQSTATNRVKLYVNGVQETLNFVTTPSQNFELQINLNQEHRIGRGFPDDYGNYMLAEMHFIDGQQVAPVDVFGKFDATTGVWNPIEYSGTYGTNGFHLDFSDNSSNAALGFDANVEGTRYSAYMTGSINSSYPYANLFDGNTSTFMLGANGAIQTWTPGTGIDWTDSAGGVEVYFHDTTSVDKVRINGGSWVVQQVSTGGWEKVSTGDGTITKMEFSDNSNQETAVYAIRVNGTILTDPSGANDWTVNNVTSSVPTYTATAASGALDSSIFDGSNTKTYWQTSITITGITVASGANFGYRGVVESGNSAPSHTITKNGTQIGSFTGTVGNNNWVASTNYTVNQGTISEAIGPSDTVVITTNVQAWHGTDQITINGSPIVQPGQNGTDSLIDTPTNYAADSGNNGGNYATLNPLDNGGSLTLSNGNLEASNTGGSHNACRATFKYPSTGKWYYEATITTLGGACCIGVDNSGLNNPSLGNSGTFFILVNSGGSVQKYNGGSVTTMSGMGTPAQGGILQVAYDADADKLWLGLNNNWMGSGSSANGNPGAGTEASISSVSDPFPVTNLYTSALAVNFGQRPFTYTPPTGFKSICTQNLPDPTIADGSDYFDTAIYTGNGSTQSIANLQFSPDFLWIKNRTDSSAAAHRLFDTVRGANKTLFSNFTNEELEVANSLTSFDSNGFTVGSGNWVNGSGDGIVGWAWDAGSSTASNTDGDITSSVRANPTAGFSIVKWTTPTWAGSSGRQVGHGLGAAPAFIITKGLTTVGGWYTYHKDLDATNPNDYYLTLNTADARSSLADSFGPNIPNSTTFGDRLLGFTEGEDSVAFCFAPVAGYSAFGSFVGNGSTDGVFVFTDFRPALIVVKRAYGAGNWHAFDTTRDADNRAENGIYWNLSSAETVVYFADINSNGFKLRTSNAELNGSGDTYIYLAFAEHPFQANGGLAR